MIPVMAQTYGYGAELGLGHSFAANKDFPNRNAQSQLWMHMYRNHENAVKNWQYYLRKPQIGLSLGLTDYGNATVLGRSITVMPFVKFQPLKNKRFNTYLGLGSSYFTTSFDPVNNPLNRAITTDFTWTFRGQINYQIFAYKEWHFDAGLSIVHHSNGHTSLPNNGLNSIIGTVTAQFLPKQTSATTTSPSFTSSKHFYFSAFSGLGYNVLYDDPYFNQKKQVYTIGGEYGKIYNRTWKLGIGAFYRFYEHYYDYITDGEFLVREGNRFEELTVNPFNNATTLGVYVKGELLLDHIGIELSIGANIYKPAYKIDYTINEGWENPPREFPDFWQFGELDSGYTIRHIINSRLGINYYPLGTDAYRKHNFYAGAHINANYGRADFTELRLGYVYEIE